MRFRFRGALGAAIVLGRLLRMAAAPVSTAERLRALPIHDAPLDRPVSVRWNAHAIPFVRAETDGDLAVSLGVVHRHLRQAQLEVLRRVAAGRSSAMIGPLGLSLDRTVLALDFRGIAERIAASLPDATRLWASRFVDGLNHHGENAQPAPELAPLGIKRFEPWTLIDVLTLARLYSADLTWPMLTRLLALRDRTAPMDWQRDFRRLLRMPADEATAEAGEAALLARSTRTGSNAAALAAERSRSGGAMLGGDPHLSVRLPNTWLLAGLGSPTVDAVGLMLPGMPFVACGRNRHVAWGGTSLHAASSELVDLSGVPETALRFEAVAVPVRFHRRPATVRRAMSPHGPVVSDGALFRSSKPLALRWIGERASDELTAMLGVLRARDAAEFRHALDGFAVPGQCMVYAGPDGIGRQVAAHLPKRPPGAPRDLVATPERAAADWSAIVTGSALFSEWNPASGFVASANERLEGPPPDHLPIGWFFAAADRVSRLRTLLAPERGPLDFRRFAAIFLDERQPNVLPLRDRLVASLSDGFGARRVVLVDALRSWDGGYDRASRGALAFELLLAGTAEALLAPGELRTLRTAWASRALVAEQIRGAEPAALRSAVDRALPAAARRFRRYKRWGAVHRHRLGHPLDAIPVFGRRFRGPYSKTGGFEAGGGNDTLNKTGHAPLRGRHVIRFGGTARYAFDLADLDRNECVLLGGQDGWPGSANFADQVDAWQEGRAIVMPLRPERVAELYPVETVLRPR